MPSLPLPGDTPNSSSSTLLPLLTEQENKCGSCAACCTAFNIPVLEKPEGQPCQHLCETGCSIYRNRPDVCREYSCAWLTLGGDQTFRPNAVNLLCHVNTFQCYVNTFEPISLPRIQVLELTEGAAATEDGRAWISRLLEWKHSEVDETPYSLPVCVGHCVPDSLHEQSPQTWHVSNDCLYRSFVLEKLREYASIANEQYRCGRNQPCPCGSGLKFKRCHARFVDIIIQ
jgi:Fe-S-cluster containining protein